MLRKLLEFDHITVQCPDVPDEDSLACAFALHAFFTRAGREVSCLYAGPRPVERPNLVEMLRQFPFPLEHVPGGRACPGLLVLLDCQPESAAVTAGRNEHTAVLGHRKAVAPLPELSDVRPHLSACATLLWLLLREVRFAVTPDMASALLYALDVKTKGFAEVRFPLDLDARDALRELLDGNFRKYDKLKRSSFTLEDLAQVSRALDTVDYHTAERFALLGLLPGNPSLLGFVSDLALRVNDIDIAAAFSESDWRLEFSIRSGLREVKALDLARRLCAGHDGAVCGNAEKAGGELCRKPGAPWPEDAFAFFLKRARSHLTAYDIIDCAALRDVAPAGLGPYRKLPAEFGYVPCAELFPGRGRLRIRMLEGDINVQAGPDIYLMIGAAGEVYPIGRTVFEKKYLASDKPYKRTFEYAPAVIELETRRRVELARAARTCASREGLVLARQLDRGAKVFTAWDPENYMKGEAGDWLVVSPENMTDQYIVTNQIFTRLYRPETPH